MKTATTPWPLLQTLRSAGARASTPLRLQAALALLLLTTLLCTLAVFFGARELRQGMQIIGKDSAPSIIAAQQIKTDLAAMHAQEARMLLGDPKAEKAFEERRLAATQGLLDAAMNITYGESEKKPIRDLLNGLGAYEQAVAQARVLHDKGAADASFLAKQREADALMHGTLLRSADDLDKANFDHLAGGYAEERVNAGWAAAWTVLAGLGLLAVLTAVQVYLFKRTRRIVNPALAAATVLTFIGLVLTCSAFWAETSLLKRAKEDAFDSIHALMQARAEAQDAAGDTLRGLVDPGRANDYARAFEAKSAKLAKLAPTLTAQNLQAAVDSGKIPAGFEGYLADELRNITFTGEDQAAKETLKSYLQSLDMDRKVGRLAAGEPTRPEAIRLGLGDKPDEAGGAFARFDAALDKTLQINRDEFDKAVDEGFAALSGFDVACPLGGLAVALLAFLGLRPRLKEYAAS